MNDRRKDLIGIQIPKDYAQRADEVAELLSREKRLIVSRQAAIRYLIDDFLLSRRSISSPTDKPIEQAA